MRKIKIIMMLIIGLSFSVSLYSEKLDINTIKINIDREDFVLNTNVSASVKKIRSGDSRIAIGASDRIQKIKFFITADLDGLFSGDKFFDSRYNQVMIMFKSADGNLIISPSIRLVRDSKIEYVKKNITGKKNSYQKEKADWKSLNRRERISSGKGIVRNRRMEGTSFSLNIKPIFKNGVITEITGSFSGIGKRGKQLSSGKTIIKGNFRIEVK